VTADPVRLGVRSTDVRQHVTAERVMAGTARFEEALAYARKADAHVWTVIVQHLISDALAARIARDRATEPDLDAESVVMVVVGCFRCEQELDSRIVHRACPGDTEDPR
jgi:hypothetical protein